MRRITSVKKAIDYFRNGSKIEKRVMKDGKEYTNCIPPESFIRMNVTYSHRGYDVTQIFYSFQWHNYADMLEKSKCNISSLVVYYDGDI